MLLRNRSFFTATLRLGCSKRLFTSVAATTSAKAPPSWELPSLNSMSMKDIRFSEKAAKSSKPRRERVSEEHPRAKAYRMLTADSLLILEFSASFFVNGWISSVVSSSTGKEASAKPLSSLRVRRLIALFTLGDAISRGSDILIFLSSLQGGGGGKC